jgi:hypothetical protein
MLGDIEALIHKIAGVGDDIAHELRMPLTYFRMDTPRAGSSAHLDAGGIASSRRSVDCRSRQIVGSFYRSDKSRRTKGPCLGLSLVAAIVKLHGFHLTITPGSGCTAEITFPQNALKNQPKETNQQTTSAELRDRRSSSFCRALQRKLPYPASPSPGPARLKSNLAF